MDSSVKLSKPVDPDHFAGMVLEILGARVNRMRILSVDDNAENLYLIERLCLAQWLGPLLVYVHV
jgi:hypothetical protein